MKKKDMSTWTIEAGISPSKLKSVTSLKIEAPDEMGCFFTLPNKRRCYISNVDMQVIEQIRKLPPTTRIKIMDLTETELEEHLNSERAILRKQLIAILKTVWYWRETGDLAVLEHGMLPFTNLSQAELLKKIRRKNEISRFEIENIIEWFHGERREVYSKD